MSAGDRETRRVRRNQLLLFSALAAAGLLVFAAWLGGSGGPAPAPVGGVDAELAGAGTAEASWVRRSEARIGGVETRLREMETRNRGLEAENRRLQGQLRGNAEDARETIDRQAAFIDDLSRRLEERARIEAADAEAGAPFPPSGLSGPGAVGRVGADGGLLPEPPMLVEFALEAAPEGAAPAHGKPVAEWLPPGSHAEAVVLSGVDASAGVESQGDPRPVLLRLTGPAHSAAADGTALTVDVEGCTVTGAAHGDLSSEKVYVRLRTLTCAGAAPGHAVETPVAGFVSGTGKAGVRGPVVSREGALVEKAFLAGLVSGLGDGVSQAFQPQAVATGPASAATANADLSAIGRAGVGAGAGSAGRKVADYLIRRAEQYQPVIQLRAGAGVTVVFIEGAWLDGRGKEQANG